MEIPKIKIKKYQTLVSTSLLAKKLKNPELGLVILADQQTGGYGRKEGRTWFSPKGGLYFTIILPKTKIKDIQILNILAAWVIANVIKENFNLEPFIKLPNDVWVNGKKICGVLTENVVVGKEVKFSIMGIGFNTNIEKFPKELEDKATSLKIELKREVNNEEILKKILKGLIEQLRVIS